MHCRIFVYKMKIASITIKKMGENYISTSKLKGL